LPPLRTQRMTPTKSLEPREVAIRGDQFTAVLDGQGRHLSIGDQRVLNGVAHFHKQVPVCATRHDEDGSWPLDEPAAKYQGCLHRRCRPKDLGPGLPVTAGQFFQEGF
jgi:hypothetical protein